MDSSKPLSEVLREWAKVFMHRSGRDFKRFMETTGLTFSQINILMRLMHGEQFGVSDIAAQLGITNAAVSQAVDRLVQMGFVERREDPSDRRAKRLTLTAKGQALIQQSIEARTRWIEQLTASLTPEQAHMVSTTLILLTEAAQKEE
ncbi:MAG: MarR family transcriptional regulator [Anaerolineales bacterium]|nr:MarR family transcriptional regulator [Anaerolineales bacterium]MDW8227876.1 MarR family transcriptional regulator [Anaerolineales bacterium]